MSYELDGLIRKGKAIEQQIALLTGELSDLREEIAAQMGEARDCFPASEAMVDRVPLANAVWQIAPGRSGSSLVENSFDEYPVTEVRRLGRVRNSSRIFPQTFSTILNIFNIKVLWNLSHKAKTNSRNHRYTTGLRDGRTLSVPCNCHAT